MAGIIEPETQCSRARGDQFEGVFALFKKTRLREAGLHGVLDTPRLFPVVDCFRGICLLNRMILDGRVDLQVEPLNKEVGGFKQGNPFPLNHEVQDVAATMAMAETIPAIFVNTNAKGRATFTFDDWAGPPKAITFPSHLAHPIVMLQDLNHRDFPFDGPKIDKCWF